MVNIMKTVSSQFLVRMPFLVVYSHLAQVSIVIIVNNANPTGEASLQHLKLKKSSWPWPPPRTQLVPPRSQFSNCHHLRPEDFFEHVHITK